jgi:hypothetical protein
MAANRRSGPVGVAEPRPSRRSRTPSNPHRRTAARYRLFASRRRYRRDLAAQIIRDLFDRHAVLVEIEQVAMSISDHGPPALMVGSPAGAWDAYATWVGKRGPEFASALLMRLHQSGNALEPGPRAKRWLIRVIPHGIGTLLTGAARARIGHGVLLFCFLLRCNVRHCRGLNGWFGQNGCRRLRQHRWTGRAGKGHDKTRWGFVGSQTGVREDGRLHEPIQTGPKAGGQSDAYSKIDCQRSPKTRIRIS